MAERDDQDLELDEHDDSTERDTPKLTSRDVDDDMAADWAEIQARHASEDAGEDDGEDSPGQERPAGTGSQQRGSNGRFASLPDAQDHSAVPVADPAQRGGGNEAGGANARNWDLSRAPSTWGPTARNEWGKLPDAVRRQIYQREEDGARGAQQLAGDARFGQSIQRVIDPHRQLIEMEGGTPEAAVADLLRTAAILRLGTQQQKYQTVMTVLNRYGINPAMFAPRTGLNGQPVTPQGRPAQFFDPRVDSLLQNMQTQEQNQAAAQRRDTENLATRWLEARDAQGKPLRPYAGDVIDLMSVMIPSVMAANPTWTHEQVMESAYSQAIWANPEIRAILQAEAQAGSDAQPNSRENLRRVNGAKRAASGNVPRRASVPMPAPRGTMDETLLETARELGIVS